MDAMIQEFSLALRSEGKSPKTVKIYTKAAEFLQTSQGIEDWSDVTRKAVRSHVAGILDTRSSSYANQNFRSLQQFFKYLEAEEGIKNPMTGMKPPKVDDKLVPVIPESDWQKIIEACSGKRFYDIRDKAIMLLFHSSGARRSEIANLNLMDIDLDALCAVVTGKGSKMRIVRFDAATGLALSKYIRTRGKHRHATCNALWIGTDGPLHPDAFNTMFKRRSVTAGVKVHPHMYRHDFSHRWLLKGGQETDLMSQNGWSSSDMLRRYGASAAAERARSHYDKVMSR